MGIFFRFLKHCITIPEYEGGSRTFFTMEIRKNRGEKTDFDDQDRQKEIENM